MKLFAKFAVFILADQITKWILFPRNFFILFVRIHGVKNYGLPFGINLSSSISLVIVVAILLVFLFYYFRTEISAMANLGFVFIFAGAISNIIDRIVFGYVRDFLDIGLNFTFNLADVMIIIGLIILVFSQKHEAGIRN